jgi:hypothetical protein
MECVLESVRLDDKGTTIISESYHLRRTVGENFSLYAQAGFDDGVYRGNVGKRLTAQERTDLLLHPEFGSFLEGQQGNLDIAQFLAKQRELRESAEDIGGVSCRVISAAGREGEVTIWIAPSKGFNALKWTYHKTAPDDFNGRPLGQIGIDDWLIVVDSVEVQQVEGRWFAVAGRFTLTTHFHDGEVKVTRVTVRRKDIETKVDFAKLNAFQLDLPDGSVVTNVGVPGVFFEFRNGKMVPKVDRETIAEIDKQVDLYRPQTAAQAAPSARPSAPTAGATDQGQAPVEASTLVAQAESRNKRRWGGAILAAIVILAGSAAVIETRRRRRSGSKSSK